MSNITFKLLPAVIVCFLFQQDCAKTTEMIWTKLGGRMGQGSKRYSNIFGAVKGWGFDLKKKNSQEILRGCGCNSSFLPYLWP